MIERLLAAEGALARDELDHAAHLYEQVAAADPRNAIAVVGLARVAVRRGDSEAARGHLEHALEIDPDEAAARRLLLQLEAGPAEAAPAEPMPAEPMQAEPVIAPARSGRSFLDRLLGWFGLRSRS
jgi:thioredoxin-like negative regulator of GroEL